jgi:hypothetical protein
MYDEYVQATVIHGLVLGEAPPHHHASIIIGIIKLA